MWFNEIIHLEPYQLVLKYNIKFKYFINSTAWLSSVRVLICLIKFK